MIGIMSQLAVYAALFVFAVYAAVLCIAWMFNAHKWFVRVPLVLLFTLAVYFTTWFAALFVRKDGWLPNWLWWYQTPDAPAIGDKTYHDNQLKGGASRWWAATCWLMRNPGYGLDERMGAPVQLGYAFKVTGDALTHNTPLHEGRCFRVLTNPDGLRYWQFHAVYRLTSTKCLKVALGWKLWGDLKAGETRRLCCTISPFTKYTTSA